MILAIDLCFKPDSLSYSEFVLPLIEIIKSQNLDLKVCHYTKIKESYLADAKKIILCGTSLNDSKHLSDINYFRFLKTTLKPVLGICAGCQTIAKAFGCKIAKSKGIGVFNAKKKECNDLIKTDLEVYCIYSKVPKINDQFKVILECNGDALGIKHKKLPIYGLLFHPEVRQKQIIIDFLNI